MLGGWWFGCSPSSPDSNFLRVGNVFPNRRLSDNTLMTPKIRIAPSCASSPGGTPGSGLPTRRHSSIGPQERRGSTINLSPPTVSCFVSAPAQGFQFQFRFQFSTLNFLYSLAFILWPPLSVVVSRCRLYSFLFALFCHDVLLSDWSSTATNGLTFIWFLLKYDLSAPRRFFVALVPWFGFSSSSCAMSTRRTTTIIDTITILLLIPYSHPYSHLAIAKLPSVAISVLLQITVLKRTLPTWLRTKPNKKHYFLGWVFRLPQFFAFRSDQLWMRLCICIISFPA